MFCRAAGEVGSSQRKNRMRQRPRNPDGSAGWRPADILQAMCSLRSATAGLVDCDGSRSLTRWRRTGARGRSIASKYRDSPNKGSEYGQGKTRAHEGLPRRGFAWTSSQGVAAVTTSDLVGLRIKTVRRQRGLSQAQLAHPELSDSYVSLIESGKRTPTPAVLELLAQKLDCSLSYLVNGVTAEQMEDIELALGYARLAMENGEISEARTRFAELLADNNLAGLQSLRQDTEYGLALAAEACGDHDDAIAILNQLRLQEISQERRIEVAIAMCRAYRDSERLTEAVQVAEEIISFSPRPAWSDLLVELGATLLLAYLQRGDLLRARQFAAELLNAADTLGTPRSMVAAHWNAAHVANAAGHGEEALTFAERAMALQAETGQPRNIARMRLALGQLQSRIHPDDIATAHETVLKAVAETPQTSSSTVDRARSLVELARVEVIEGDLAHAAEHATAVRDLLPASALVLRAEAGLLLSLVNGGAGYTEKAQEHLQQVRELLIPLPDSRRSAAIWYATAETTEQLGDQDGAVEAYQRALACAGL